METISVAASVRNQSECVTGGVMLSSRSVLCIFQPRTSVPSKLKPLIVRLAYWLRPCHFLALYRSSRYFFWPASISVPLDHHAPGPSAGLRIASSTAGRRRQTISIERIPRIAESQILREKGEVRSPRRIAVAIHLQTGVEYVVIRGARVFPSDLVIAEADPPAARLPNVAADAQHLVERESPTHARLPQITAQCMGKCRNDRRAIATIHVNPLPDAAAQPVEKRGAIEIARTVMGAATAGTIVSDHTRAEGVHALRYQGSGHVRRRGAV